MIRTIPLSQLAEECSKEYSLFQFEKDGYTYRGEKTRLGIFLMCKEAGEYSSFQFLLPKIPYYMWRAAINFFGFISAKYNTEAALQLFYDVEHEKYCFYVPHQTVTIASVDFMRNPQLEYDDRYILVADIHSHGIINAFFSMVDDADELGTRIYAVFGGYRDDFAHPDIKVRAGSGGLFKSIPIDMLVDDNYDMVLYMQTMEYLSQMGERIKEMTPDLM